MVGVYVLTTVFFIFSLSHALSCFLLLFGLREQKKIGGAGYHQTPERNDDMQWIVVCMCFAVRRKPEQKQKQKNFRLKFW